MVFYHSSGMVTNTVFLAERTVCFFPGLPWEYTVRQYSLKTQGDIWSGHQPVGEFCLMLITQFVVFVRQLELTRTWSHTVKQTLSLTLQVNTEFLVPQDQQWKHKSQVFPFLTILCPHCSVCWGGLSFSRVQCKTAESMHSVVATTLAK